MKKILHFVFCSYLITLPLMLFSFLKPFKAFFSTNSAITNGFFLLLIGLLVIIIRSRGVIRLRSAFLRTSILSFIVLVLISLFTSMILFQSFGVLYGETTITASFADGLDPYEIWWKQDGVAVDSVEEPIDGHPGSHLQTSGPGEYTVYAVDSHYETIQATCVVTEEKLTVVQQPVGGELPLNQYVEISAEFSGGEAPYTYYLYCNGKAQQVSHVAPSFKVWYPCTCSILAVDAKKRSVMTNTVTVSEATFRIKEQTESTSIYVPYGKARIHVTPENGITPYTYEWSYGEWSYKEGRYIWYKLDGTESYYDADRIGRYRCLVRDAEKNADKRGDAELLFQWKDIIAKQASSPRPSPMVKASLRFRMSKLLDLIMCGLT